MAHGGLRIGEPLALAIRERRIEIGASATRFANHGIDDIEAVACAGATVSAPMLVNLAGALEVDLVWFIEREPAMLKVRPGGPLSVDGVLLDGDEGLELLRAFAAIRDEGARRKVLELAKHFAAAAGTTERFE